MALTNEDLKEIKKITDKAVDNLAIITKRGFDDVDEKFAKIEEILNMHTAHFDNHHARLSNIEDDLDYLKTSHHELFLQVQRIDDKLAFMGDNLKKIEKRLTAVEKRLTLMEKRMDGMEKRMNTIGNRMDNLENKVDNLTAEVKSIHRQLNQTITEDQYEIIEKRVLRLEQAVGLAV